MSESKIDLQVARSLYAQMCHFHDETEEQRQGAALRTKKTSRMVKGIGALLLIFVVVIAIYISELAAQFVQIIDSMDSMNTKVVVISEQMSNMKVDVEEMTNNVAHMNAVLVNVKKINGSVISMSDHLEKVTANVVHFNEFGIRAMKSMTSMNKKMDAINNSTGRMNNRMRDIARPARAFPNQ